MDKQMSKLLKLVLLLIITMLLLELFPLIIKVLSTIVKFLLPFILGFTIAFLLSPLVDLLEKYKFNRKAVSILLVILFVGLIVIGLAYVGPVVAEEVKHFINNMPKYLENIEEVVDKINEKLSLNINLSNMSFDKILGIIDNNGINLMDSIGKIIQGTFSYLIVFILTPILALYFLIDYHKIKEKIKNLLVNHKKEHYVVLLKTLEKTMYSYFIGVFAVMLLMVLFSFLSFTLIKLELALLWGIVIGITNIIPYVGPYIGGIIVGVFTLSSDPSKFIYVLIIIVVLQIVESNFITPLVEKKTVKTHPILGIFFLSLFSEILGIFGMIIAIPVLSLIQITLKFKKTK